MTLPEGGFSANQFTEIVRISLKHGSDDMMREAISSLSLDELLWLEQAARQLYDDRAEQNEADADAG